MPGFAAGSPPRWRRAVCLLVASGFAFVSVTGGPTRATAQTAPAAAAALGSRLIQVLLVRMAAMATAEAKLAANLS